MDYQFTNETWSYVPSLQSVQCKKCQCKVPINCQRVYWNKQDRSEFAYHNKMYFSILDNDQWKSGNCVILTKSGWWFNQCDDINLNKQPIEIEIEGDILFSEMKIRPKDCHIIQ